MSLFDILNNLNLNNLDLGSALSNITNNVKSAAAEASAKAPGGMGGLLGAGALGTLIGAMMSKGPLKNTALVGAGAIAWSFYQKWAAQQKARAAENSSFAPHQAALAGAPDPTAMLLLRAMVDVAKADGHIDEDERRRINQAAQEMFPGQDIAPLINQLLSEPLNPEALAREVQSKEQGEDLYRLSCFIVDIDHFMERSYLDALARALGISDQEKAELEREAAEAKAKTQSA